MLISTVETSFLGNRKKPLLFKMFEEIAVETVKMLTFFWAMIASVIVLGWMPCKRRLEKDIARMIEEGLRQYEAGCRDYDSCTS